MKFFLSMELWKTAASAVEKLWAKNKSRRESRALCRAAEPMAQAPHTIA